MIGWILRWWKQKHKKSNSIDDSKTRNHNAYEHSPPIIRIPDTLTEEAQYRKHDSQYKDRQIRANRWIILATVATAAGTVWQGYLTRQALLNTEQNGLISTDQVWRAIDNLNWQASSMDRSQKTAQSSVQASIDSLKIQIRPYVIAKIPTLGEPPTVEKGASVNIDFENIGKSPALRVISEARLLPFHISHDQHALVSFLDSNFRALKRNSQTLIRSLVKQPNAGIDLAPTQVQFGTKETKLTTQEVSGIQESIPTTALFYIGVFNYTDSFRAPYETEFCYFFIGTDPRVWHLCDAYNRIK